MDQWPAVRSSAGPWFAITEATRASGSVPGSADRPCRACASNPLPPRHSDGMEPASLAWLPSGLVHFVQQLAPAPDRTAANCDYFDNGKISSYSSRMSRRRPGTLLPLETEILEAALSMQRSGHATFH